MSVVAGKINLSTKEMENKMEKLDVKEIIKSNNSIFTIVQALENKQGIASEQPWVYLASLLYSSSSKKSLAMVVDTINGMENK